MIGLGTQDSLGLAEDFISTYGGPDTMLWDSSFESWRELGIRGQPAGMLLSRDGTALAAWSGAIPEAEVLAFLEEL